MKGSLVSIFTSFGEVMALFQDYFCRDSVQILLTDKAKRERTECRKSSSVSLFTGRYKLSFCAFFFPRICEVQEVGK